MERLEKVVLVFLATFLTIVVGGGLLFCVYVLYRIGVILKIFH